MLQRNTPAQQYRSLCHYGLIQLVVLHQLTQQGISWEEFISRESFTVPPQPDPEVIHEEGGPSQQHDMPVPRHVSSLPLITYQRGQRALFAAARRVLSPQQVEGVSPSSSSAQRVLSPHLVEGALLSSPAQAEQRGKEPMIEEEMTGDVDIDIIDLDTRSPTSELQETIQQKEAENRLLQQKLEMAQWTINYLEQCNKQLEEEKVLDELWRIRSDRNWNRRRPGDLLPKERESMLIRVNAHLERLLAKANRDNRLLRNMKNHYWARMHVCKAKMKMFQRRLTEALKRRQRPNPLRILAEVSLTHHDTH